MENHLTFKPLIFQLALFFGLAVCAGSCEYIDRLPEPNRPPGSEKVKTFYGPATPLGQGIARAWVSTDKHGTPLSVGVNVSERAIHSLEDEAEVFTLTLPKQAENTLYDHITLDWNPHGHPVEGIYTLPHFDLHFYMISEEQKAAIPHLPPFDENGDLQFDELPAPAYIPEDYIPEPGIIPNMGAHWLDELAPELHGETFTQTYIYGSYDGEFTFHEPMFTVAYLNELKQKEIPIESFTIKQPDNYQMDGYYPMNYSFIYKSSPGEFSISLDNLMHKTATLP